MQIPGLSLALLLSVWSSASYAQDDYDDDDMGGMGDMGGDMGDMGGMGGDGDGEPPAPELEEFTSIADFDKFLDDTDASVVGAFTAVTLNDPDAKRPADWDDEEDGDWEPATIANPAFAEFKSISSSVYGWRFGYTTAPEVLEKIKTKSGGVFLYRSPRYVSKEHGDRARERFPGDKLSEAGVTHWLEAKAQPLVGEHNAQTESRYKSAVLLVLLNLDWEGNSKNIKYVLKRARKVAVSLKGKLAVAVASIASSGVSAYGLRTDKDSDILMAIHGGPDFDAPKYGAVGKAFSAETLTAFANSYLAGELTPHKEDPYLSGDSDEKTEL